MRSTWHLTSFPWIPLKEFNLKSGICEFNNIPVLKSLTGHNFQWACPQKVYVGRTNGQIVQPFHTPIAGNMQDQVSLLLSFHSQA